MLYACTYMCTYVCICMCVCVLTASGVVLHTHTCVHTCLSSRLEWSALVDPVIDKACNGFVVSPHLARALHFIKDEPLIANSTIFNDTFYKEGQLAKVHTYIHMYVHMYVVHTYVCTCVSAVQAYGCEV